MPVDNVRVAAAGYGVHEVQFYGDDGELAAGVASFLGDGLGAGCPAVVVATPAHRAAFGARLGAAAGRVVMVDAATMLQGFLAGDRLDTSRFRNAALGLLGPVARPEQPVRIYAEMVALLWDAGQVTLALELEAMWKATLEECLKVKEDEPPAPSLPEQYLVLVQCQDEKQQTELLQRFAAEGLECRALLG